MVVVGDDVDGFCGIVLRSSAYSFNRKPPTLFGKTMPNWTEPSHCHEWARKCVPWIRIEFGYFRWLANVIDSERERRTFRKEADASTHKHTDVIERVKAQVESNQQQNQQWCQRNEFGLRHNSKLFLKRALCAVCIVIILPTLILILFLCLSLSLRWFTIYFYCFALVFTNRFSNTNRKFRNAHNFGVLSL